MEETRRNFLAERRKNMSPQELEAERKASLEKRRAKKLEQTIIGGSIKKHLGQKYMLLTKDADGNEVREVVTGKDLIAKRLINDLINPKTTVNEAISIATFLRDTMGEKPKEKVEKTIDNNITLSWESMVKKMQEE